MHNSYALIFLMVMGQLRTRKLEEIAQNIGLSQLEKKQETGIVTGKKRELESDGNPPHVFQETVMLQEQDMYVVCSSYFFHALNCENLNQIIIFGQ